MQVPMIKILLRRKGRQQGERGREVFWVIDGNWHVAGGDGGIYSMSKVESYSGNGLGVAQPCIMVPLCN